MSWPLGYVKPTLRFRGALDGTVLVNDVVVTESNGWIDVPAPRALRNDDGTDTMSIRIRVAPDGDGHAFLYAEQLEIGGRRYGGVHALMLARGSDWVDALSHAIHDEIAQRVAAARSGAIARSETRPMMAVRPPIERRNPDETWRDAPVQTGSANRRSY